MNEGTHHGLVAYFDILGYQCLLERNEPETIAQEVIPLVTGAGPETIEILRAGLADVHKDAPEYQANIETALKDIQTVVFSDTILLTMPMPESIKRAGLNWLMFLTACIGVQNRLFKAGMPVRGAIDYGRYYLKDMCFAGRPIISAYQLSNRLEVAACVFSDKATEEYFKVFTVGSAESKPSTTEYLVPLKDQEKHMLILKSYGYEIPDIRKHVMEAFWGHNKDIPVSAERKLSNTEKLIRFLQYTKQGKKKEE